MNDMKLITKTWQGTTAILLGLLFFEDLPLTLVSCSLITNVMYYFVLQTFPFIQLASPVFLLSVGKYLSLLAPVLTVSV